MKDAAGKIDVNADMSAITSEKTDAFYDGDASKWIKYANSLRLRYAMRLSAVDQAKAKAAFEDAASTNNFITTQDEIAQVQEKGGWTDLDGVMSRPWNGQAMSVTFKNLVVGLGGQVISVAGLLKKPFEESIRLSRFVFEPALPADNE